MQIENLIAQDVENKMRMAGKRDASDLFGFIKTRIEEFEENLTDKEEIGIRLANFGEVSEIRIRNISYRNPNIMVFEGINSNGEKSQLLQHISQLNLILIACNSIDENKPFRMGFL